MPVRDFRVRPLEVLVVDDDRTFGESLALFLGDDERAPRRAEQAV
jgi:hypothetical protein